MIGCGYEEPIEGATPWAHPGAPSKPTICVGYTTGLPVVREVTWLSLHWERGSLAQRMGGEPDETDWQRLEAYENARSQCQSWAFKNPPKAKP